MPHPFTCTFCWHLITHGTPHFVCGELIYRDEECVSLGWCFWHRACYGCLFYGSKLVVTAPTTAKLYKVTADDNETNDNVGLGKKRRELLDIPMCANCVASNEGNDESTVQERALTRVDRADGGLSRYRWNTMGSRATKLYIKEQVGGGDAARDDPPPLHSHSHPHPHRLPPVPPRPPAPATPLPPVGSRPGETIAKMHYRVSKKDSRYAELACLVPLDSAIYVSLLDPLNEPAFKPSPAKPIPSWMQLGKTRSGSVLDVHVPPPESTSNHRSSRGGHRSGRYEEEGKGKLCPCGRPPRKHATRGGGSRSSQQSSLTPHLQSPAREHGCRVYKEPSTHSHHYHEHYYYEPKHVDDSVAGQDSTSVHLDSTSSRPSAITDKSCQGSSSRHGPIHTRSHTRSDNLTRLPTRRPTIRRFNYVDPPSSKEGKPSRPQSNHAKASSRQSKTSSETRRDANSSTNSNKRTDRGKNTNTNKDIDNNQNANASADKNANMNSDNSHKTPVPAFPRRGKRQDPITLPKRRPSPISAAWKPVIGPQTPLAPQLYSQECADIYREKYRNGEASRASLAMAGRTRSREIGQ
ncbi:hypothetical protein GGS20DRAFT_581160 [Poronia punctata]|nr:hypothetical protein GGS20DRAFT_581160 [Poronia punctata]